MDSQKANLCSLAAALRGNIALGQWRHLIGGCALVRAESGHGSGKCEKCHLTSKNAPVNEALHFVSLLLRKE